MSDLLKVIELFSAGTAVFQIIWIYLSLSVPYDPPLDMGRSPDLVSRLYQGKCEGFNSKSMWFPIGF